MASQPNPYLDVALIDRAVAGLSEPADGIALLTALMRVCDDGAAALRIPDDGDFWTMIRMEATSAMIDSALLAESIQRHRTAIEQRHLFAGGCSESMTDMANRLMRDHASVQGR